MLELVTGAVLVVGLIKGVLDFADDVQNATGALMDLLRVGELMRRGKLLRTRLHCHFVRRGGGVVENGTKAIVTVANTLVKKEDQPK